MFRNYLSTALRNLFKHKLYAGINIGGLALGLAVAILIVVYVRHELSYERWVPAHEQVYRAFREWPNGGRGVWTPDALADAMRADLPEVAQAAALSTEGETLLEYRDEKIYVKKVASVDSAFLDVVALPLHHGNPREALRAPGSVVISARLAGIFFGTGDPLGQPLRLNGEDQVTVTGVLEEFPGNTHLHYEVYARRTPRQEYQWTSNNLATYVRLRENTDPAVIEEKLTAYVSPILLRELRAAGMNVTEEDLPRWGLQPFADIHLQAANVGWHDGSGGDIKYVYIFLLIAGIVLLIASINYVNLATARALGRAREVGVRKVTGAHRRQLIAQFMGETLLQTLLALGLALALAEALLPAFNQVVDRELVFLGGAWGRFVLPLLGLAVLVSLVAGGYPAFVLSAFQPVRVLKGGPQRVGGQLFRRVLVVAQFAMSIVLVIVMLFIFRQVNYMTNQQLGFAGEQILLVPMNTGDSQRRLEQTRAAFLALPGVREVSAASRFPGQIMGDWAVNIDGQTDPQYPNVIFADAHYAGLLGLEMAEGRFFSGDFPTDTSEAFVVNEAFVREYGIEDPIGKKIKFSYEDRYAQIVGVVRDYHHFGLDRGIRPLVLRGWYDRWYAAFKLSTTDLTGTIAAIRRVWERIEPAHPMRHSFLDEDFGRQYEEYRRFGRALLYATILAIVVAALGLFGLAAYAASTRTREIGIRKVLGASTPGISLMLMRDFVRWVLIAGLIAAPLALLLARRWLEDFAYRTTLSPLPFLLAIGAALLLAALTVSVQAIRAARNNPVEALRSE